jgi:hypothetical protein
MLTGASARRLIARFDGRRDWIKVKNPDSPAFGRGKRSGEKHRRILALGAVWIARIASQSPGGWILDRLQLTIDINGRSILIFDAGNLEMAEQLAASSQFQAHLRSCESVGGGVWDGRQPIRFREALLQEVETWKAVFRTNGEPERDARSGLSQ